MREPDSVSAARQFPTTAWRSSSRCAPDGGNCVQVNLAWGDIVGIRDNKPPAMPELVFRRGRWRTFVSDAATERFRP